ncbi:hypothetical protein [Rhodococcus opacus]|uniref:Uncharacterized protein n=1 Tax=Rhodococcus opacus TaxID=37919 RepID=A0A2S8JAX6_RHOOP|nr:hypothetical protein [Rhodococcus opacus]PQP24145.1 hypothetical protein C5613_14795 [Rhodococcus opacus]
MSDFFLPRDEQLELVELLREIPELVEDLAVTISRQDRLGSGSAQISPNSYRETPVYFNERAAGAAEELRAVLVSWVAYVLEERGLQWEGDDSTLRLARWLDKNVVALSLTPGSEEALDEITDAVRRIRRVVDRAPDRAPTVVDNGRILEARVRAQSLRVSPAQAEALVEKLGYAPLKAATIRKWAERGKIEKGVDGMYCLGDILELTPLRPVLTIS